jgi:hypothetical protein
MHPDDMADLAEKHGYKFPEFNAETDPRIASYKSALTDTPSVGDLIDTQQPKKPILSDLRKSMREDLIDTKGVAQEVRERAERDKRRPYR